MILENAGFLARSHNTFYCCMRRGEGFARTESGNRAPSYRFYSSRPKPCSLGRDSVSAHLPVPL